MTICESLAVQNCQSKRFAAGRRIYRQKRFEIMEDEPIFENENSLKTVKENRPVGDSFSSTLIDEISAGSAERNADDESCRTENVMFRRTLSVEKLAKGKKKRSSVILDWLTNPENNLMYEGRSIDSRIFRSHSAVESRNFGNFAKNTRYHSLREQEKDGRIPLNVSAVQHEWISEPEIGARDLDADFTCAKQPVMTKAVDKNPACINPQTSKTESKQDTDYVEFEKEFNDRIYNAMDVAGELSTDLNHLSLDNNMYDRTRGLAFHTHHKAKNCNSLPSYGRLKEVKLRRLNSDAMFYKGRNYDKRKSFEFRRRKNRLSFQLRNLFDKNRSRESLDTGTSSAESDESSSSYEVNSSDFVKNIEKIITHGDLRLIHELAECGFDFNAKDSAGNSALHYAALRGNEKIISEILENGGNVWVRNNENQLPVELASNINVRMLLSGVTLFYRGQYSHETESRLTSKQMCFEL